MKLPKIPVALLFATGLMLSAQADRLVMIDGSTKEGRVGSETFNTVTIKIDGKNKSVKTGDILNFEYDRKPALVDEADLSATNGALEDAVLIFEEYLEKHLGGKPERRYGWAPAYAYGQVIELNLRMNDYAGAIAAADRLIKNEPESRQLPKAYLQKAEAQFLSDKGDQAQRSLTEFQGVIDDKGMGEYWRLECRLALVQTDSKLSDSDRRKRLGDVAGEAGSEFPVVANRARVLQGESFLSSERPDFDAASKVFTKIVKDPKADDGTLAGAYVGLGDCIFQTAARKVEAGQDAPEQLKEAMMYYMRTAVLYPDQAGYRSKALYQAGRCYDLMPDSANEGGVAKSRARTLWRTVVNQYAGSYWAEEADKRL